MGNISSTITEEEYKEHLQELINKLDKKFLIKKKINIASKMKDIFIEL